MSRPKGSLPLSTEFNTHCMDMTTLWRVMAQDAMETSARFLKTKPGYEKLAEKVENLGVGLYAKIRSSIVRDDQTFIALCHGDLWCNNIMFAYDSATGLPSDAILLDYQISYWGPAISDVANTLLSSSHEDLCDKDWDHLLQFYHRNLVETFQRFKYTKAMPTLTDIQTQFIRNGVGNVAIALLATGARKFEAHRLQEFSKMTGGAAEMRFQMMSNPDAWKQNQFLFDYFDRKGYFE